jgi:hypothetical protein
LVISAGNILTGGRISGFIHAEIPPQIFDQGERCFCANL